MSDQDFERRTREFEMRRRTGMAPGKAAALAARFEEADDLYWTCPKCKSKLVGTLEQLKKGCDCAKASTGNGRYTNI